MPTVREHPADTAKRLRRTEGERREAGKERQRHYRACFETISGQIVLADLLRLCGVLGPSESPFREGQRSIGMHLIEMMTRDPDALLKFQMTSETGDLLNE